MKKILKHLLVLLFLFMLTGCLKTEIVVSVDKDQTITIEGEFLIEEAILTQHNLTLDDIIETSSFKDYKLLNEGVALEKDIDQKHYVGKSFKRVVDDQSIIQTQIEDHIMTLTVAKETIKDLHLNLNALEDRRDNHQFYKELGAEASLIIQMPGKITYASIGEIDNDTLTIDLISYKGDGILVKSELSNYSYIYIMTAVVAFIISFIFISKHNKMKK